MTLLPLVFVVSLAAVGAGAFVACSTTATPDAPPLPTTTFCSTDKDCTAGLLCTYVIGEGCSARGECRDMSPEGGVVNCDNVEPSIACGCDGSTVSIPACWAIFAPVPVSGYNLCDGGSGADAGTCVPSDESTFMPQVIPSIGPHAGACSNAQVVAEIDQCYGTAATPATCTAWSTDPTNAACAACTKGPLTANPWPPLLFASAPAEVDFTNIPGCIALADPSQASCAQKVQASLECEIAACLSHCPVAGATDTTGQQALLGCFRSADVGTCKTFADSASACEQALPDGGPESFCLITAQDNTALTQLFSLACGLADGG